MRMRLLLAMGGLWVLTGCASNGLSGATPIPTLALNTTAASTSGTFVGGVTASGVVVADREARLGFTTGGRVTEVRVAAGDRVQAGQVLIVVDDAAARRAVDQAERALAEFSSQAAVASARLAVADARKALEDAQKNYNNVVLNPKWGNIMDARERLEQAKARYSYVLANHDSGISGEIQIREAYLEYIAALQAMQKAEAAFEADQGMAPDQITLDQVTARYETAKAILAEAEYYLAAITGGDVPAEATGASLTAWRAARDRLEGAMEQLNAARMTAPFDGTVVAVTAQTGGAALPGAVLVILADDSTLHVETTDLSERDIPRIRIGQAASVFVSALNQTVTGKVRVILPQAETLGGDVVYRVWVDLDQQVQQLLAGMSVEVDFQATE